jgi:transcriptional regulator with XRE-family HTH domain
MATPPFAETSRSENLRAITAEQLKAARALLGWSQNQLAIAASVSIPSVRRFERKVGRPHVASLDAL